MKTTFLTAVAVFIVLSGSCHAQNEAKPRFRADTRRVSWNPVKIVLPEYPQEAKEAGIGGSVVLEVIIGEDGKVLDAIAIYGPTQLRPVSKEAVIQWRWEPYSLVTKDTPRVRTQVTFKFDLNAHPQVSTKSSLNK